MSHIRVGHVTLRYESCHRHIYIYVHLQNVRYVTDSVWWPELVTPGIFTQMRDMTHSCVWRDSFMRVTWLSHACDVSHSRVWRDSFMHVTWLIHACDMTHSCVWRDVFICVTWLIHICNISCSDPFREVGGWGRDPQKCTGRGWGMGSSTI